MLRMKDQLVDLLYLDACFKSVNNILKVIFNNNNNNENDMATTTCVYVEREREILV